MALGRFIEGAAHVGRIARMAKAVGVERHIENHFRGIRPLHEAITKPGDLIREYNKKITPFEVVIPSSGEDIITRMSLADARSLEAGLTAIDPENSENQDHKAPLLLGKWIQTIARQESPQYKGRRNLLRQRGINNDIRKMRTLADEVVTTYAVMRLSNAVVSFNRENNNLLAHNVVRDLTSTAVQIATPLIIGATGPLGIGAAVALGGLGGRVVKNAFGDQMVHRVGDSLSLAKVPEVTNAQVSDMVIKTRELIKTAFKLSKEFDLPSGALVLNRQEDIDALPNSTIELIIYSLLVNNPNYLKIREPISAYELLTQDQAKISEMIEKLKAEQGRQIKEPAQGLSDVRIDRDEQIANAQGMEEFPPDVE